MQTPNVNREDYFDLMEEMFSSKAWKLFVDECDTHIEALKIAVLEDAKSVEDLFFIKGKVDQLAYICRLDSVVKFMREQEEQDDADDSV